MAVNTNPLAIKVQGAAEFVTRAFRAGQGVLIIRVPPEGMRGIPCPYCGTWRKGRITGTGTIEYPCLNRHCKSHAAPTSEEGTVTAFFSTE